MDIRNLIHHDSALASTSSLFSSSYTSPSLPSTFPPPPARPQLDSEPSQQTIVPSSFASSSTREDRAAHGDPGFLSSAPAGPRPPSRVSLASLLDSEPSPYPSSSTHRDADADFKGEEKTTLLGPPRLINSRTPSPVLSYSHSPASSSCSLQPPTPDSLPEYPTCFHRKRIILPHSPPSPTQHQPQVSSTSALDLLAVVADISSAAGPSSERSVSPRSDTASLGDASSSSGSSRKRMKMELKENEVAGVKRATKKRKGRGLDPQKTRLMIFPPTLPPRSLAPVESEGYTKRPSTSAENLYAPTYTKGRDSRTRVAFCEYCGESALPTRMSGFGYHLLHTHNLSSHPPYIMPSPLRIRTSATDELPPSLVDKELAVTAPSPALDGECPFTTTEGGVCAMGGWHKLSSWRESMNSHLGGKGLNPSPLK